MVDMKTDKKVISYFNNIFELLNIYNSKTKHAHGLRCNDQPKGDSAYKIPFITLMACKHGSSLVELTCICLKNGLYSCNAASGWALAAYGNGGMHYIVRGWPWCMLFVS